MPDNLELEEKRKCIKVFYEYHATPYEKIYINVALFVAGMISGLLIVILAWNGWLK
ncbi:MAG: hypothetical protein GF364_14315 [Candidatus Lokiarchaeota archaeon]|nr:hypothetical protein [Candidatus Lokiarchaeota archaeon]